ncbi:hypothetical protein OROHE_006090 [Orobanche hederae]
MIFDDHSSIYVGGLPYDITEDSLRRVFCIYGAVLAVKIINDRSYGGKCYGFVTFANPRSAMQAINEMDGKTINGRVVKVNEVRSRGGKPNLKHMCFRDDMKSSDGDRGRDRGRVGNYGRQLHHEEHGEVSHGKGQNRERGHDRCVDEERFLDCSRRIDGTEQEHGRKHEGDCENDIDMNIEQQRNNNHHKSGYKHKHQQFHLLNRYYSFGLVLVNNKDWQVLAIFLSTSDIRISFLKMPAIISFSQLEMLL